MDTKKHAVFWDVGPCGSCKNRRIGGKYCLHHQDEKKILRNVLQLLVTANVVPSLMILFTLMMKAISFSETSVLTRATRHHIPEYGFLHSHRRENLKS
jgi:hypothetical protein